jgi:TolB-like protein
MKGEVMKKHLILATVFLLGLLMVVGCGSMTVRSSVKPFSSEEAQQFSSIKKIAVLPFDNLTKQKDAEKLINALLTTEILNQDVFDSVEDVRYVASVMKMLKIKRTQILDRDLVLKMGETMRCEAVIVGEIDAYKIGKKDDATDISISVTMLDTRSGDILWTANVTNTSSTSVGKVFGITPGPNHISMTRDVVATLAKNLAKSVEKIREEEAEMEVDRRLLEEETAEIEGEEDMEEEILEGEEIPEGEEILEGEEIPEPEEPELEIEE